MDAMIATLIYAAILFVLAFCSIVGLVVVSQAMVEVLVKERKR